MDISQSTLWELYLESARSASKRGRVRETEHLLLKALSELTDLIENRKAVVIATQHMLANLYRGQKRYSEAERLYLTCFAALKSGQTVNDGELTEILRDYALCLIEQGRLPGRQAS